MITSSFQSNQVDLKPGKTKARKNPYFIKYLEMVCQSWKCFGKFKQLLLLVKKQLVTCETNCQPVTFNL